MIIVGASGHGKVVLSTALAQQEKVDGFLDDDPLLQSISIQGYPVLGNTQQLTSGQFEFVAFGLGRNKIRQQIAGKYPFINWKTLIHPHAYVHPSAKIGKGTVIFAGAVIQPDVQIGEHCIINTGATIDHDCVIGDYVHLAPGVHLAGGVTIGEGSFLGIASAVIQCINIGDWATVAAGGIVINNISSQKTVMGLPAKERLISC